LRACPPRKKQFHGQCAGEARRRVVLQYHRTAMLPADARKSSQAESPTEGTADLPSCQQKTGLWECFAERRKARCVRLPANHRQSRGWREAHRKKVLLQHDATRLSAACSPPPSSAQPQKALPGRPCWQCLESREANPAGVLPLRLASAVWTSHFTSFHTTRFTLHTSHFTPHTSHLTPHTSRLTPHTTANPLCPSSAYRPTPKIGLF
jgi:hypothetical protein